GIDVDEKVVKTARRVMKSDPYKSKRGTLEYEVSDFSSWNSLGKLYDLVIFNRVLHHIPRPNEVLDKVKHLLTIRGRIICIEYAYDRFEDRKSTRLNSSHEWISYAVFCLNTKSDVVARARPGARTRTPGATAHCGDVRPGQLTTARHSRQPSDPYA